MKLLEVGGLRVYCIIFQHSSMNNSSVQFVNSKPRASGTVLHSFSQRQIILSFLPPRPRADNADYFNSFAMPFTTRSATG